MEHLGGLVEVDVGAIAETEHGEFGVLQEVGRQRLVGQRLPEEAAVGRQLALAARRHDAEHLVLVGQVVEVEVVHGDALGAHAAPLELRREHVGEVLGVARLRAVQHGDALAGRRLAEQLLQVLQQLVVVHGELLQALVAGLHRVVEEVVQLAGRLREVALQLLEAVLAGEVLLQVALDLLRVELERVEAAGDAARVVAVQRPVAAVDGLALFVDHLLHVDTPVDARRVGDDEGCARVVLRLLEGRHAMVHVGAERDGRDEHVAVLHGEQAEVLLVLALAHRRELRDGRQLRRLRHLAARVRVHLRVEHEHVDVLVTRQDVVEAAVADVVCPAVAADHPVRLRAQHVAVVVEEAHLRTESGAADVLEDGVHLGRVLVALVRVLAVLLPVGERRAQLVRHVLLL